MRRLGIIRGAVALSMGTSMTAVQAEDPALCGPPGEEQPATIVGAGTINGTNGDDVLIGDDTALPPFLPSNGANDDRLEGGPGNDIIAGLGGADDMLGGPGDDELIGMGGDDRALGGPGHDTVFGGPGEDVIAGEPGNDTLGAISGVIRSPVAPGTTSSTATTRSGCRRRSRREATTTPARVVQEPTRS